jgi:hypothetical protein
MKANAHPPTLSQLLADLATKWPSTIISRDCIEKLNGGTISVRYQANLDSLNQGPPSFYVGRKRCYRVDDYVSWLQNRVSTVKPKAEV